MQYTGGLPLEAWGGIKYVGKRVGNTANDLVLKPYATGSVHATYALSYRPHYR